MSSPATTTSSNTNISVHLNLAGSKLRQQHARSFQEHVSAPPSTFAQQHLAKLGWTPGTGLGKDRTGTTTHIKVKQRVEQAGLGSTEVAQQQAQQETQNQWWKASLGDTLAKLSSSSSSKKKKKKSKKSRTSSGDDNDNDNDNSDTTTTTSKTTNKRGREFTDEELFEATGGARFGMRAGKTRKLAKWKRAESGISLTSTTTTNNSNTNSDNSEKDVFKAVSEPNRDAATDDKKETDANVVATETKDDESKRRKKDKKKKKKSKKSKSSETEQ